MVVPVYNEADLIGRYVRELDEYLHGRAAQVMWFLIDDASTDGTAVALQELAQVLGGRVRVLRNPSNLGHGPTVMRGYELALKSDPDLIMQIDGDGHYLPVDVGALLDCMTGGVEVARGARRARQDPWFRLLVSELLRIYVGIFFAVWIRDVNIGLRIFRPAALQRSLRWLRQPCPLPNLYLSIAAARVGYRCAELPVTHHRRPGVVNSTTWETGRRNWLPPFRLLRFVFRSLWESFGYRRRLKELDRL
jgi:glycosyltransferase involved in cell wall biosynthesis